MEQFEPGEIPIMKKNRRYTMLCGIAITTGDLDETADRQLSWTARPHGLDAGRLPGQRSGLAQADPAAQAAAAVQRVDGAFIRANAAKTPDWPTIGVDYAETRYSRLDQINAANVKDLGLAWSYNLESTRGVEATPVVVDGIMYVSASWSVVHAIDTRTGNRIWTYDPQIDRSTGFKGCCDVVNRGVALWKGKVYVGAWDGRLIALDAATGKEVWQKNTFEGKRVADHHRRAARVQGQGHHRQRRRRIWRARLHHGL
jgi:quinohemoprotein ethanol dehydrogenase